MASLERRLADTESALLASLLALQDQNGFLLVDHYVGRNLALSSKQERSKADKQDEWERFPLRTRGEMHAWLHAQPSYDEDDMRGAVPPLPPLRRAKKQMNGNAAISLISTANDRELRVTSESTSTSQPTIQEQLKRCDPPTVPNNVRNSWCLAPWYDSYF